MLSDEQMSAVSGAGISAWTEVDRPGGPQPLPAWVRGAHINWMNGCGNAPDVMLKVAGDVYAWDNQRWAKEGKRMYITRHDDGRARVLYHDGAVSDAAVWRVYVGEEPFTYKWAVPERASSAETWLQAAEREGQAHLALVLGRDGPVRDLHMRERPRESFRLVVKSLRCTTLQSGFGGDGYLLAMLDGSEMLLRGPWHGGAPAGYVEVATYDCNEPAAAWRRNHPWHRRGGRAGMYITEDLYLRIMARYCAHAPIARVQHSYGARLEPFRAEWGAPKAEIYELEIERARRNEPAGQFWRVYWDGRGIYCGRLRIPEHGFRPEVTDLP